MPDSENMDIIKQKSRHVEKRKKPTQSWISKLTFNWVNSIITQGHKKNLVAEDLLNNLTTGSEQISNKFNIILKPTIEKALEFKSKRLEAIQRLRVDNIDENDVKKYGLLNVAKSRDPTQSDYDISIKLDEDMKQTRFVSLFSLIMKTFRLRIISCLFMLVLIIPLPFINLYFIDQFLPFMQDNTQSDYYGMSLILGIVITSMTETIMRNQIGFILKDTAAQSRVGMTCAIFNKIIRLSHRSRQTLTSGQIVNMVSIQVNSIGSSIEYLDECVIGFFRIIGCTIILYYKLGFAIFGGFILLIVFIVVSQLVMKILQGICINVMMLREERFKITTETINALKIIKIYAWETSFFNRIKKIRDREISYLYKQVFTFITFVYIHNLSPDLMLLVSLALYVYTGDGEHAITIQCMIDALILFTILRQSFEKVPSALSQFASAKTAFLDINKFLELDENDRDHIEQIKDPDVTSVRIVDTSVYWNHSKEVLKDINLEIPKSKLTVIVGRIGSGKSTLLSTILGETQLKCGSIQLDKRLSISYVPQNAWIINDSIENNIRMGFPLLLDKYKSVIESCALEQDLAIFPMGDQTNIGEKGLNLSGGQKQRISLARAVYAQSSMIVLDDPLSAVDGHVGEHIFNKVIGPHGLLADCTRIMVTNKLSLLTKVENIVVLDEGRIVERGSYENLLAKKSHFYNLHEAYEVENKTKTNHKLYQPKKSQSKGDNIMMNSKNLSSLICGFIKDSEDNKPKSDHQDQSELMISNPISEKETSNPKLKFESHKIILRSLGFKLVWSILCALIGGCGIIMSMIWLGLWSTESSQASASQNSNSRDYFITYYAMLVPIESTFLTLGIVFINFGFIKLSKTLHDQVLGNVLRAKQNWLDITPSGRILNCLFKDMDNLEDRIRLDFTVLYWVFFRTVAIFVLISLGSVYSILVTGFTITTFVFLVLYYTPTGRQLRRLESESISPVYSHLNESFAGLTSIKTFNLSQYFTNKLNQKLDKNNELNYLNLAANCWLNIRLLTIANSLTLAIGLITIEYRSVIPPGISAIILVFTMITLSSAFSLIFDSWSRYESNVVCIERLNEYTQIPTEKSISEEQLPKSWPSEGRIIFDNYSARYRPDLGLAIKDFNLDIAPGEKVGIVGRTGAGKSSIALSLLRIFDAASGRILIDGIDICRISLNSLRSSISIIPQDPILFNGSIRENIDPMNEYNDTEIWKSIELAHLSDFVHSLTKGLDYNVSEGGSNFSLGQRQLFCLARALLRNSKILLLDEATASVDPETDNLIQETIRKKFSASTVITIAHRIETILDYDKIVVMDCGRLLKVGSPRSVL